MAKEASKRKFVTKKKISGVRKEFRPWKEWEVGDSVTGKFVGTHRDNYENDCPIIEVEEATFKKRPKLAEKMVGKNLVLNSTGMLDKAFEKEVSEGDFVKIEYGGTNTIDKGKYKGKESHVVNVELLALEDEPSEEDITEDADQDDGDDEDQDEDDEDDEDTDGL